MNLSKHKKQKEGVTRKLDVRTADDRKKVMDAVLNLKRSNSISAIVKALFEAADTKGVSRRYLRRLVKPIFDDAELTDVNIDKQVSELKDKILKKEGELNKTGISQKEVDEVHADIKKMKDEIETLEKGKNDSKAQDSSEEQAAKDFYKTLSKAEKDKVHAKYKEKTGKDVAENKHFFKHLENEYGTAPYTYSKKGIMDSLNEGLLAYVTGINEKYNTSIDVYGEGDEIHIKASVGTDYSAIDEIVDEVRKEGYEFKEDLAQLEGKGDYDLVFKATGISE